jgi:hypothetical protein
MNSPAEAALFERLNRWAERTNLKETSAEAAFIESSFAIRGATFQSGQAGSEAGLLSGRNSRSLAPARTVGPARRDLAVGYFKKDDPSPIPQVLCEFKDIRSGLDADQNGRGIPGRRCGSAWTT